MSSVTIQGNPSGTGIFTVASPNSNTNRTLNLPDQSGDFITTDSSGAAVLPRVDSSNEGGQINFNRAVDNVANWSIDSFGNDTTPTLRFIDGGNVRAVIDGSGNVGIATNSPAGWTAKFAVAGSVLSGGQNYSAAFSDAVNSTLRIAHQSGLSNLITDTALAFYTANGERARIDTSGRMLVGTTSGIANGMLCVRSGFNSAEACSFQGGTNNFIVTFHNTSGTLIGSITGSNGSTTSYNTSSDYRLKEDIQPMTGALAKVAALKPVTYKWKVDGSDGQGFIAHELAEVCPDAVSGEKDEVNEDGSIKPQGIDTSFLVATLTAAIKEQQAIIEQLTTRIAALEAK